MCCRYAYQISFAVRMTHILKCIVCAFMHMCCTRIVNGIIPGGFDPDPVVSGMLITIKSYKNVTACIDRLSHAIALKKNVG